MSLHLKLLRGIAGIGRRAPVPTETICGFCPACGGDALFRSHEPIETPCKRNTFLCEYCGSAARNRHVAQAILAELPTTPPSRSLAEFGRRFNGRVWLTATEGAIARHVEGPHCFKSEFVDGVPSGSIVNGVRIEDLQASSFASDFFDLVVTEDVLEHVASPDAAFREIRRVLKPGGLHICTIPINWDRTESVARAVIEGRNVRHVLPPEYHGDPMRPEGILAFTDFGRDVAERFCSIVGPTEMLAAHGDRRQEEDFGIFNSWVFVSRRSSA